MIVLLLLCRARIASLQADVSHLGGQVAGLTSDLATKVHLLETRAAEIEKVGPLHPDHSLLPLSCWIVIPNPKHGADLLCLRLRAAMHFSPTGLQAINTGAEG